MKIHPSIPRSAANVLVVTLFITAALGIVLASYLTMIGSQRNLTGRSEAWNRALVLAESGIEEGLAHLNQNATNAVNLGTQGWQLNGAEYTMHRDFSDGYYEVSILAGGKPLITSSGYSLAPGNYASASGSLLAAAGTISATKTYISRTVQVECDSKGALTKAIVARDTVNLNGKSVFTDSYHSYDPASSTNDGSGVAWGQYDASKRRDNGDVAVIFGLKDDINVSGAKIRGHASTGANGDIDLKGKAAIGSNKWIDDGNMGIEPGWSSDDANFSMPPVVLPFTTGVPPLSGFVGTNYYDMILDKGDYKVGNLKGKVLVRGTARILATGNVNFSTDPRKDEGIEIDPGARLEIYADCMNVTMTGKKNKKNTTSLKMGLNAGGNATNSFLFATDKCTSIDFHNMDTFTGVVYAPNAEVKLKAGSPKYYHCDVFGSISGKRITLEKNATFHYDENVGTAPGFRQYVIKSWREL